mmetsp:Transcript_24537/g.68386  ORF Transcript_24537/g.68386 Transcript_24537/m.68386 type:complete len:226 (+) Transcript_24537:524-1201(+)
MTKFPPFAFDSSPLPASPSAIVFSSNASPNSGAMQSLSMYLCKHCCRYAAISRRSFFESSSSSNSCVICASITSRAARHSLAIVRRPPSKTGGKASRMSSSVTSAMGFRILVLYEPPFWLSGSCGTSSVLALGNTMMMAVSNGTQPGAVHDTCITITDVPMSNASSGIIDSTFSTMRRLCCRSSRFSLAENMLVPIYYINSNYRERQRGICSTCSMNSASMIRFE